MDGNQLIAALQELSDFERGLPVTFQLVSGVQDVEAIDVRRHTYSGRMMVVLRS